ncbi:hypothetical protein [Wenxinia saemankumensis]|uniref:Yip1 domain-containing protein n=1 Tax=Wenxinia saemankumensis TaxID=1447782 RepID=A0A1M6H3M3_9RHOB|nr:hypothetical protein [Wenxinia saemankumensis]SHJ16784.1 hypothetical protein SAMN05444417_3087 [Wenxinia saemankumensis]
MAVTTDIARTYRAPRGVVRSILNRSPREGVALAFLMIGCALVFVGQWPRLSREGLEAARALVASGQAGGVEALARDETARLMAYEALGWLFVWPLFLYLVAGISYLALRRVLPALTGLGARVALFWAVLAAAPLALLFGLTRGIVGEGPAAAITGALWLVALLWFWIAGLRAAGARRG